MNMNDRLQAEIAWAKTHPVSVCLVVAFLLILAMGLVQ